VVNNSSTGSISGAVTKNDETPLEDATLAAFDGTVEVASTSSKSDGSYAILGLPAGTYDVTASHSGFTSSTKKDVNVVVGNDTGGTDFSLTPPP